MARSGFDLKDGGGDMFQYWGSSITWGVVTGIREPCCEEFDPIHLDNSWQLHI
jgi:hypothetical protein